MATKQQESLTLDFIGSVTQHWNAISHAILLRSQNRCDKWQRWNDYYRTQICRTADHEFANEKNNISRDAKITLWNRTNTPRHSQQLNYWTRAVLDDTYLFSPRRDCIYSVKHSLGHILNLQPPYSSEPHAEITCRDIYHYADISICRDISMQR